MSIDKLDLKIHINTMAERARNLRRLAEKSTHQAEALEFEVDQLRAAFDFEKSNEKK